MLIPEKRIADFEKLVLLAKEAGCRYITFTTRHHEGFSLYDTCGLNEYDSLHSPAKREIVVIVFTLQKLFVKEAKSLLKKLSSNKA